MAKGYVKTITINVENRGTPEIAFTLLPTDGGKAGDVVYTFSGNSSEPHAYLTVEKVVMLAFQAGIPIEVTASDTEHYKEVLIVSISK